MANNLIKIKRTAVSGRAANTVTLPNAGELALNMTDGILYSTNGSNVFEIGANNTNVNITNTLTVSSISANGGLGTNGQVLTTNGSIVYWSTVTGGSSSNAALAANSQTFTADGVSANFALSENVSNISSVIVSLNGLVQSPSTHYTISGNTLTFTSTPENDSLIEIRTYYGAQGPKGDPGPSANSDSQYTWTNTHTFTNTVSLSTVSANGGLGTNGQVLTTNGTTVYWSTVATGSNAALEANSQTFTANGASSNFALSSNVSNISSVIVSLNGLIQSPTTHYTISGNTLTFTTTPTNNSLIEIRTYYGAEGPAGPTGPAGPSTNVNAQYTWANTQTFSNTITFSQTINGTVNNSLYLGGVAAADYQTEAGLAANVATLAANSATYVLANTGIVSNSTGVRINFASDNTWTGTQTFTGSTSKIALIPTNIAELATISAISANGTINYDVTTQSVLYYTSNSANNWTVNFRGSSGTSLNTLMSNGQIITVAFLVTQGATAYYNNVVQIDSANVTPLWQGGTAPTAGNPSAIDIYTYTIVKTASSTFTLLAAQTQFK